MLEELLERSRVGYHSLDANGNVIYVNNVWLNTLGYKRDEVIGEWFGKFIHESYLDKFKANFPKLREKGIIENFTFVLKHRDGSPVELIFNGMAEKDANGEFVKTLSAFHSNSPEQKTLYGNIDEKLINKSRMELMGEMMSAVAHHWRQPLNALGLLIQDNEDILNESEAEFPEIIENIKSSMQIIMKMSETIDQFCAFSVPSKGAEPLNLTELIINTLDIMADKLKDCLIDFSFISECPKDYYHCFNEVPPVDCASNVYYISGVRQDVIQVLLNVISNAVYAVTRSIANDTISRGKIDFHVKNTDKSVTMSILNNGDKIPEEILPRIFEPYFSTKGQGDGDGMGLYTCKVIVEKHLSGTVSIGNTDSGVMFVLEIPVISVKSV
ncbi:MAG: ATP-binding protein [Deferribacterales bacterium]